MPAYTQIIERSFPGNELVSIENTGQSIIYKIKITRYIKGIDIILVDSLVSSIHSSFQFVTLIIYYSLLFAWPSLPLSKRIKAFSITLPIIVLFVCIDIPVTIISSIDLQCIVKLQGIPLVDTFSRRVILFLSHFFNNGGRQFFAVMLFAFTIIPFSHSSLPLKSAVLDNNNRPAPKNRNEPIKSTIKQLIKPESHAEY
ncbi:MAG: hypothetical protein Q8O92_04515 [Candidatus Latescibacter sp.]|nr:hypothetical protein [Candidatus Latescibacter sp.]